MGLIKCPDCEKMVSERVESCPFCGCPAKFFTVSNDMTIIGNSKIDNQVEKITNLEKSENDLPVHEDIISFYIGSVKVDYPRSTEKIAKLYGKYVGFADKYYDKYISMYSAAGSMYNVLTDISQRVITDIKDTVDEACKDLYSFGIKITTETFISKYEIDFIGSIEDLYLQYNDIQKEKEDIEYKREIQKSSRGRWQGGGFGMQGAIKGAMNAAVLNAGSGLLHSIGDGIAKSSDKKYIKDKLNDIYISKNNKNYFADKVYDCIICILEAIKIEMADEGLIDIKIFGNFDDIESNFETTVNYEKNHEKFFEDIVQCISCIPEFEKYYKPILTDLFSVDCDIEKFLDFWGLSSLYSHLEEQYVARIVEGIDNSFVKNVANKGIEISKVLTSEDSCVTVRGKVIKGSIYRGDRIVHLKNGLVPNTTTTVISISDSTNECSMAKIGRDYDFVLQITDLSLLEEQSIWVDDDCLNKVEADAYVAYYKNGKRVIWSIDKQERTWIQAFDAYDRYVSFRGIELTCDVALVKKAYGDSKVQMFDAACDITQKNAKHNDWKAVIEALEKTKYFLSYSLGEPYVVRFYFDFNDKLVLAVYMNDVNTSSEIAYKNSEKIINEQEPQIICKKCNKSIKANAKFCNFCGANTGQTSISDNLIVCPKCGKAISESAKFCNFCGDSIVKSPGQSQNGAYMIDMNEYGSEW